MGEQWKQWQTLFFWAPKSLQMEIAAMKLKDAYSFKGNLWPRQHIQKQRHYFANKGPSSHGYGFSCAEELILLNCGVGEDFWESLGLQGDPTSPSQRRSVLGVHWKDSCWSWNSNHLAILCKGLTHLKRPWCWERLKAGGEGDNRGWYGWMASLTRWTEFE